MPTELVGQRTFTVLLRFAIPEAVIVFGKYAGKTWSVVLNFNTLNVITVRRASKKEKRFYEQETGN